jgi:hypothetical protein
MQSSSPRQRLATSLERDARAQLSGAESLGQGYDDLDSTVPRDDPEAMLALQFWDAWVDEHEHGFPNRYDGITESDWPRLAARLAQDLRNDQAVRDQLLLRHFGIRPPVPLGDTVFAKLRRLIGR